MVRKTSYTWQWNHVVEAHIFISQEAESAGRTRSGYSLQHLLAWVHFRTLCYHPKCSTTSPNITASWKPSVQRQANGGYSLPGQ